MKHEVINGQAWGSYYDIKIRLYPETNTEKTALKNVEEYNATDAERELIDNYTAFNVRPPAGYGVVSAAPLGDGLVEVKAKYLG